MQLGVGLGVLASILVLLFFATMLRSRDWTEGKGSRLKGLALPKGSIRALIAFLILGAFVVFVFFGKDALTTMEPVTFMTTQGDPPTVVSELILDKNGNPVRREDTRLYIAVLTAFGTLTGAVTGFYFAARTAEPDPPRGGGNNLGI